MKIEWSVAMPGIHGAKAQGSFEIEDDATDEDIEKAVLDEISSHVAWGWERVEK